MALTNLFFLGKTKAWWVILVIGIIMIPCGFFYWLFPGIGFMVVSQMFAWVLLLAGCAQLTVGGSVDKVSGRWWWLAGGIIDIFLGFTLMRNVILTESIIGYFFAFIFIYWGIMAITTAFNIIKLRRIWWLYLINGILLCIIGYFFLEGSIIQDAIMVSFMTAIAFMYWGLSLCLYSIDLKPDNQ